ncbi:uncharacterized protein mfsd8l1 [Syngnathoides biaculeatus]|uniref:uncharacterized protein mfsd8l1 n=1 Tax=Syngnathoides biaculeatus TaxID=300417 RepID=UPI002ADD6FAD|nr:uncharacterized protein mfsd8l1 [Syngnathoides biaculeatus]XP_061681740.1 uncharacterized protein mfsd8l1 [Syngnathoides biaculeatus]
MHNGRKKKLTFFTIGLIFLLSGVEYAVILPTIWKYLQTLEAPSYFLGLALSAFSFSGLISGPLFGHWSDRTQTTKKIIFFANLFEIVGNFMYFMGFSKWLLLSSRLVAGIGTGAGSSIFGLLTRSTAPEDRSTVFAAVMVCRQVGLVIGPAFNIFLRLFDFRLGPFVVNAYTAPGLFMCFLWILLQFAVFFMYWDLPPLDRGQDTFKKCSELGNEKKIAEEEDEEDDEVHPLMRPQELVGSYGSVVGADLHKNHSTATSNATLNEITPFPEPSVSHESSSPFTYLSLSREFLREEVLVLLTAQFITLFNQTALETMVTPLTQRYFNYGELENSIMYSICGVEVIAGFLFVRWLSQRFTERVILAIGLGICIIAAAWCLVFLSNPLGGFPWQLTEFIIGMFLQLLGLPFVAVSQVSLFSKVTSVKTQGFSQGVRRSVGGLATILGPLWAGGLVNNLHIMMGVMMALLVLITMMLVFSYKRLVEPCQEDEAESANCC